MIAKDLSEYVKMLRLVPASELFIDVYQRTTSKAQLSRMIKDYNPYAVRPYIVFPVGRRHAIVDGQHSHVVAGKIHPGYLHDDGTPMKFVCYVLPKSVNPALLFAMLNTCSKPSPDDIFRAMLVAKCPRELDIVAGLDEINVTLLFGPGQLPKTIRNASKCSAAYGFVYDLLGSVRYRFALNLLDSYRHEEGCCIQSEAFKSDFIRGLGFLLHTTTMSDGEILMGLENGPLAASILDYAYCTAARNGHTDGHRRVQYVVKSLTRAVKKGLSK